MTTAIDGYKFVSFTGKSKEKDGTYLVHGRITDTSLDLDQQRMDATWADVAVPDWQKKYGNIREMHQPVVVGKSKSLSGNATDGYDIVAKIVDPLAITKLENDLYTGFSIGIKGTRYDRTDKALAIAPNGIINGGEIIEVSIVDVPANPNAKFMLAKAAGIGDTLDLENQADGTPPCSECSGIGKVLVDSVWSECPKCAGDGEGENDILPGLNSGPDESGEVGKSADCKTCDDTGKIRDGHVDCPDCVQKTTEVDEATTKELPESIVKMFDAMTALSVVNKAAAPAEWTHDPELLDSIEQGIVACIQGELTELLSGEDERWDLQDLMSVLNGFLSWRMHEAFGGETTSPFDQGDDMDLTTLGVSPDTIKAARADDATDEQKAAPMAELVKALGTELSKTLEIDKIATSIEESTEKVASLVERLDIVEKMSAPREYALRASQEQQEAAQTEWIVAQRQLATYKSARAELNTPEDRAKYDAAIIEAQSKVDALANKIGA